MSTSTSVIDCCFSPELRSDLLKWGRVIQCFIFTLLISPILLLITLVTLVARLLVTIHFKLVHESKFKLCSPVDGVFGLEKHANSLVVNTFSFAQGQTDIYKLRERLFTNVIGKEEEDGRHPYEKLTWKLLRKYGFFVWQVENDSFDIRDHVVICPGADCNTVYSEQEVLEIAENLLDDLLDPKRPQWHLLFIPKVRMNNDKSASLHYALIFRSQHAYMDGVSLFQLLHRGICDEPGKLTIDPVNPPFPKLSTLENIALYLQTFFLTPYTCYKTTFFSPRNVFQEMTENEGPKFLRCTTKKLSMESVKLMRKKFGCSTIALFNAAITGALRKAAERKCLPIPEEIDFAYTVALLPYLNADPQNRFTVKILKAPISISDSVKRLNRMNTIMKQVEPHELLTLYGMSYMVGLLPAKLIEKTYTTVSCGYAVSNVPGFTQRLNLFGNEIVETFGCPPLKNGVGFSIGVVSYNGYFKACWMVEKTKIVSSRKEMSALVADFENELSYLEHLAIGNNN